MTDKKIESTELDTTENTASTTVNEDNKTDSASISSTATNDQDASINTNTAGQANNASKIGSSIAVYLSLTISVAALAASAWLYYQSQISTVKQELTQLSQQQSELATQVDSAQNTKTQFEQLARQVIESQKSAQKNTQQLAQQQNAQNDKIQSLEAKLQRLNNTTKEDWKLAESEYLIRLANQRLLLEADSKGAIALLTNADDILRELQDPIVFETRKALAKDIQTLNAISQFDLEGRYLQLSALYDSVTDLPQREASKEWQATQQQDEVTKTNNSNPFTSGIKSFWQSLRSLVVINYDNKPIKALLPPTEYQKLISGLQLQLDVAQVSLLKGESVIYHQALSRVAQAVTEHFDTQANKVVTFLASLTELQQLEPSPKLPLPRASLVEIKSLMKAWNQEQSELKLVETDNKVDESVSKTNQASSQQTTSEGVTQ
ncbi:uroporphyrinogen-III C-methyltransferase [Marinomonas sp. THO17]|uniref:uroporphyrinogen-III C-methyltransferase n=1 Tax=Marinomonas sp. THO17 TaxID=3149048 RepID=UPI00336C0DD4